LPVPKKRLAKSFCTKAAATKATVAWARIGAMQQGSADRYFQESSTGNPNADKLVPEGIEGRVPYKGSMVSIVYQMAGGVRAGHGLLRLRHASKTCTTRQSLSEITSAGIRESHVHDVQITKEAPNYRAE
jgi:IMP dehydrogenase